MYFQQELKICSKTVDSFKREYHSSVICHQHSSSDTKDIPQKFPKGEIENNFSQLMDSGQVSYVLVLPFPG